MENEQSANTQTSRNVQLLIEKFESMQILKVLTTGTHSDCNLQALTGRVASTVAQFEHTASTVDKSEPTSTVVEYVSSPNFLDKRCLELQVRQSCMDATTERLLDNLKKHFSQVQIELLIKTLPDQEGMENEVKAVSQIFLDLMESIQEDPKVPEMVLDIMKAKQENQTVPDNAPIVPQAVLETMESRPEIQPKVSHAAFDIGLLKPEMIPKVPQNVLEMVESKPEMKPVGVDSTLRIVDSRQSVPLPRSRTNNDIFRRNSQITVVPSFDGFCDKKRLFVRPSLSCNW